MVRARYWETRTGRAEPNRSHPDDRAHREQVRDLFRAAWRASGLQAKHWSFMNQEREDWKASSILRWADKAHLRVTFVFDNLEQYIPEELKYSPEGETHDERLIRLKKTLGAIRKAMGVSKLEMDRRLDQQYCVYHSWESRRTDFHLSAMQRAVRALGGVFRIEIEHKHNPGILKRITRK